MTSLYSSYKAIGYVTDGNPFFLNRLGDDNFLTTSIGKSFQVYRTDRLVVCMVSQPCSGIIRSILGIGHETFCAVESEIIVYNRTKIVRVYREHAFPVLGLISIGKILISFDEGNILTVIDTQQRVCIGKITLARKAVHSAVMHPATYINKVIIGFSDGHLELWNFKSKKLVYSYSSHLQTLSSVTDSAPCITCLEQSPALDVVGIGFSSGHVALFNLKFDQVLFWFKQDCGAVTSLAFRTDLASEKFPFMVSSGITGRIHVWNLGTKRTGFDDSSTIVERKLEHIIEEAHRGAIVKLHFLYGEPILVSSSADNSIKMWIFDSPDGSARLLRSREGHSGFPRRIRYYGGVTNASVSDNADALSCELISSGSDGTLRLFNTAIEAQNREMSQKPILKKLTMMRRNERLPEITGYDFSETRERDWGNLVTVHSNHTNAYVWRFRHRVVTETILRQPGWQTNDLKHSPDRTHNSTAVAVSPCGNFCVVGSRGGAIYAYNLQSGLPRGAFPSSASSEILTVKAKSKRASIPGNVLHLHREMLAEGVGKHANSLNPKKTDESDKAEKPAMVVEEVKSGGHTMEVTGLFIDIANAVLTSCSLDGSVIFWDFASHAEIGRVNHSTAQLQLVGFREAGFVAVAGQDRAVRLFDTSTQRIIRRFLNGHSRQITDIAFGPDGRRLLSSSVDGTVRVWDIPTGRCLSWLSFGAPVMSIAISHSGEYLCLSQADKEGIFMYVDRSLYEAVHFWQEPTSPTPVGDSLVMADAIEESEGGKKSAGDNDDDHDDEELEADDDADVILKDGFKEGGGSKADVRTDAGSDRISVRPPQAHVLPDVASNDSDGPRAVGAITMSSLPRGYWTSLFNLELIKQRNKPTAAPAAPVQAPFFLPTVVRGGATPSFPTPAEFQRLMVKGESTGKRDLSSSAESVGPAAASTSPASVSGEPGKRVRTIGGEDEVGAVDELATMTSAWADDDEAEAAVEQDDRTAVQKQGSSRILSSLWMEGAEREQGADGEAVHGSRSRSRIIRRKTALPRCKLESFLIPMCSGLAGDPRESSCADASMDGLDSDLLAYLSSLPPPAVDVELRALCLHDGDTQGLRYLRGIIEFLARQLRRQSEYELLQAYLHRLMVIYADTIAAADDAGLIAAARELMESQRVGCEKFRHLVQTNLCALKLFSGLAPV